MNLVNVSRLAAGIAVPTDKHGYEHLLVAVKGTFTIRPDGTCAPAEVPLPMTYADVFHGEPGLSSIRHECDFALRKPSCDVVLNGHAYAPGGEPVPQLDATLEVGPVRKTVRVFGDRAWEGGILRRFVATRPQPFTKMPLLYERAFRGSDQLDPDPKNHGHELRNLVGVSYHRRKRDEIARRVGQLLDQIVLATRIPAPDSLYRFKLIAGSLTWGSCHQLRRLVVLVDHATEHLPPLDRQVQRRARWALVVGWSLLAGLVRAVPVVMAGILAQD